jgi:hypothetical protein
MINMDAALLSLVVAMGYDLQQTAEVYRHHAKLFWAAVRGERMEGHPVTVP